MNCIPILRSSPQLHRIYICLDACKKGFKAGCRPFIGLDGCFLKRYYGDHLLAAVGQDANNAFFVIAYAVINAKDKDNWKWFLTLLHEDIGDYKQYGWNFMSDIQKVQFNIQSWFHVCICDSNMIYYIVEIFVSKYNNWMI